MTPSRTLAITALALTFAAPSAAQDPLQARTVMPEGRTVVEGNSSLDYPWGVAGNRTMCFYNADQLGSQQTVRIVGLRFRPQGTVNSIGAEFYQNLRIDLSTSVNEPSSADLQFGNNHGADQTRVYDGSLTLTAQSTAGTPSPFVLHVPLDMPFEWDPKCGPLAVDIKVGANSNISVTQWDTQTSLNSRMIWANGPSSSVATGRLTRAPVMELILDTDIAPAAQAGGDSPSASNLPFANNWSEYRVMDVFNTNGLGFAGRTRITGFALRSNGSSGFAGGRYDCDITMSTTSVSPNAMSTIFDANHGTDQTLVFQGTLTLHARGTGTGPRPFEHVCLFDTPFDYDPAMGNLALDIRVHSHDRTVVEFHDAVVASGSPCARIYNHTDSEATTATQVADNVAVRGFLTEPIPTMPAALDSTMGASSNSHPFDRTEARTLYVYPSHLVPSTKPLWIQHLAFRPDDRNATFGPVTYTCTIDLSTTTGTNSGVYDDNHGSDRRRVFDGKFSVPLLPAGRDAAEFPIVAKLDSAFYYDPAAGRLVVDFRVTERNGDTSPLDSTSTVNVFRATSNDANATSTNGLGFNGLCIRFSGWHDNALAEEYGTGCAGANGTPRCFTHGLPWLPNPDLQLRLRNAASNSVVIAMLGLAEANSPLDGFGLPGCTQLNDQAFGNLITFSGPTGDASIPLAMPNLPEFAGLPIRQQWACLDPTANVTGVSLSNGQLLRTSY